MRQKSGLNALKYSPKSPKFVSGIFRNLENSGAKLQLKRAIFGGFAAATSADFWKICPENAAFPLRFTSYFAQKCTVASSARSTILLHRSNERAKCGIVKTAPTPEVLARTWCQIETDYENCKPNLHQGSNQLRSAYSPSENPFYASEILEISAPRKKMCRAARKVRRKKSYIPLGKKSEPLISKNY